MKQGEQGDAPRGKRKGTSRARAVTASEKAHRIDFIVGMMQRDEWRTGKTGPELAVEWMISPETVKQLAAEASRKVVFLAQLAADPDRLKTDVASVLMRSLHDAHDKRAHGDVARIGDIVTKIVGARAPEKQELKVQMAELEALAPPALMARLREQRARLDEAIAKLEAEHPELSLAKNVDGALEALGVKKLEGPVEGSLEELQAEWEETAQRLRDRHDEIVAQGVTGASANEMLKNPFAGIKA